MKPYIVYQGKAMVRKSKHDETAKVEADHATVYLKEYISYKLNSAVILTPKKRTHMMNLFYRICMLEQKKIA